MSAYGVRGMGIVVIRVRWESGSDGGGLVELRCLCAGMEYILMFVPDAYPTYAVRMRLECRWGGRIVLVVVVVAVVVIVDVSKVVGDQFIVVWVRVVVEWDVVMVVMVVTVVGGCGGTQR